MTNQLKRLLTGSFLLLGLLGLAACGGDGNGTPADTNNPPVDTNNPPVDTNNPPAGTTLAAAADAYTWLGNSRIVVPAVNGVTANDTAATGAVPAQYTSTLGGIAIVTADGGFTYEPPVNVIGTDTFTYTVTGAGGTTATGTVTITITQKAWYVKNDIVAGQGTAISPFNTLAAVAGVAGPGDIIFVYAGDRTSTRQNVGIDLLPNQRLLGQAVGLTFDVLPNDPNNALLPISGIVSTAAVAGVMPVITDTTVFAGNLPAITLANNVEVAGIIIDGTGTTSNLLGMSGAGITGFNIHDNTIRNLPKAAIQLSGATGGTGMIVNNAFTNILDNNNAGNSDNAIDIVTTAATGVNFTITGNTMSNVLETGIRVQFPSGIGTIAVSNNTLTNVGTNNGRRGIDVDGAGTVTISGNTVDNSAAGVSPISRSGIQVNASGALIASVTNNIVRNAAPADGGIQAQTTIPAATLCLRMTGNTTANNFILDNRNTIGAAAANFQIEGPSQVAFEAANTATGGNFNYLPAAINFDFVPVGTCFAP